MSAAKDFAIQYRGQQLTDNHGNYWGECVSLVKRFSQEKQGVPNADSVLYVKDDLAKNMYLKPTELQQQYYDTVSNSPIEGDIVVYGNPNDNSYGDVAVFVGNGQVFGQLGFPVYAKATERGIGNPLGYVRRKGSEMPTIVTSDQIKILYFDLCGGYVPTQSQIDFFINAQQDFIQTYFAIQKDPLYTLSRFVNDGDIASLKKQGVDASGTKDKFWKEASFTFKGITAGFKEVTEKLYRKDQ